MKTTKQAEPSCLFLHSGSAGSADESGDSTVSPEWRGATRQHGGTSQKTHLGCDKVNCGGYWWMFPARHLVTVMTWRCDSSSTLIILSTWRQPWAWSSNADNFFNPIRPQVRLFKDAQIPDARSQWRQNFIRYRLNICWYVAILAHSILRSRLKSCTSGAVAMKIHFLPRRKQPVSHTKAKPVNAIWEIIAACFENLRKHERANVLQKWRMLECYSSITGVTVL